MSMNDELIARIRSRADDPSTRTDRADLAVTARFVPATTQQVSVAKNRLGFSLPPFLVEVYQAVGNGGFDPAFGLIGLPGGYADDAGRSIVERYHAYRLPAPNDQDQEWPERFVPVCDWGCAIVSCVDCGSGPVVTFDPAELRSGSPISSCLVQSHSSVAAWLDDWARGVRLWDKMFEDDSDSERTVINPFTKEPLSIRKRRLRR